MDASRRTSTLRRVATTASLAALLLVPGTAEAKKKEKPKPPVITSVTPLNAAVGDTLTIKGKHFRKGKGRNTVGFKRSGEAIVFVKAGLSTKRVMAVKLPAKLEKVMGDGQAARFNLRVLTSVFGKQYTSKRLSPMIAPRPPKIDPVATPVPGDTPKPPVPVCDAGTSETADRDSDLLSDGLEQRVGTNACDDDSDDDGATDGYEYRSAIDLNDDEYQQPNTVLAYPGAMPYPNPLFADGDKDYDGDGLPLRTEHDLWTKYTPAASRTLADQGDQATPLSYSDGLQYSVARRCGAGETDGPCGTGNVHQNRRVPTLTGDNYAKYQEFTDWLQTSSYANVYLHDQARWWNYADGWNEYDIRDLDRINGVTPDEEVTIDSDNDGFLSDDERDEDADGLSNFVELRGPMQGPSWWASCYTAEPVYDIPYAGTDPAKADTDGDGVRDGADDQDHDDIPNLMELSRFAASHLDDTDDGVQGTITGGGRACKADADLKPDEVRHPDAYGRVNPFNPCMPDYQSRTCEMHPLIGAEDGPDWWSLH